MFLSIKSLCYGASGENRTLVPSLENLYTNRCTTLAKFYKLFYSNRIHLSKGKNQRLT